MKRILVTGANGYLGHRIVNYLIHNDYYVVAACRNIESLDYKLFEQVEIRKLDLLDSHKLRECCSNCDIILHLAGMNAGQCHETPNEAINVNIIGTYNIVEAAKAERVKRVLFFSTSHVYGKSLYGKITEKTATIPIHQYSITNRIAEEAVLALNETDSTIGIVLRLSNSFGYSIYKSINAWNLLVNNICRQIVENGFISIISNGKQYRDFISINNVCRATRLLIECKEFTRGFIVNLGSGTSSSVFDMVNKVNNIYKKITGHKVSIRKGTKKEDSRFLEYSIEYLKLLGYEYVNDDDMEIEMTIKNSMNWFK